MIMGIVMKKAIRDCERVRRYRKAFPQDRRSAAMIIKELDEAKAAKRKANKWLERNLKSIL